MKKIGKLLAFIGVSGAALAGLWYFIDVTKKTREFEEADAADVDDEEEKTEAEPRSYVSINDDDEVSESDKEVLKKTVASAVSESIAKAEEAADGIGIVKEEKDASDFTFESFDDEN